jgi:hypothetical protein
MNITITKNTDIEKCAHCGRGVDYGEGVEMRVYTHSDGKEGYSQRMTFCNSRHLYSHCKELVEHLSAITGAILLESCKKVEQRVNEREGSR